MPKLLTKSNYLSGLQCPKLLWISKNDKERIPEPDFSAKHNFKVGDIIGVLATKVFPGGRDLAGLGFMENIEATKKAIKKRETIYEAGIMVGNLFSRGDVLVPVGSDEWDIFEVKSGTKVKDVNIHDVSFQKHVYEKAGLKIRDCFLMHINSQYVKDGDIEPRELFVQADITEKILEYSEGIEKRIRDSKIIIKSLVKKGLVFRWGAKKKNVCLKSMLNEEEIRLVGILESNDGKMMWRELVRKSGYSGKGFHRVLDKLEMKGRIVRKRVGRTLEVSVVR